ncbi:MAG: lytic transglycosylase domain-containing protein [Bosea sp. (in: a-proteobacteria)]
MRIETREFTPPLNTSRRFGCRHLLLALMAAIVCLFLPQRVQAQVPISDAPKTAQETQTRGQVEKTEGSTKRWLQYEEGVTCGVFRNPAKTPVDAMQRTEITGLIRQYAKAYGVREELALSVAMQESRFSQNVRSCAGAIGVMQLMPGTAKQLGVDPYDLEDNIKGGVKYLKDQLIRFEGNETLAAAAFNAGPNRASLQAGRVPNIPETQTYVREIFGRWEPQFKVLVGSELAPSLANANHNLIATSRYAAGSIGGTQALAQSRQTAIGREGALVGGAERVQDAWDDNSQSRIITGQGFNRAIDQGGVIGSLMVAQLLADLAITSQTTKSMRYATSPAATPWQPRPPDLSPCVPVQGSPGSQTGTPCTTNPRVPDRIANVGSYLAGVQAAAQAVPSATLSPSASLSPVSFVSPITRFPTANP